MPAKEQRTLGPGPALAMLLLGDIPPGLFVLDALAKEADVEVLQTGTIHCGRYLILFGGEVGPVERAWRRALDTAGPQVVDEVLLPHAEARLLPAIRAGAIRWPAPGDTLGVLQAATPPVLVRAVDGSGASLLREGRRAGRLDRADPAGRPVHPGGLGLPEPFLPGVPGMKLGRVIGTLVATVKPVGMKGLKLLIVRPLTAGLADDGDPFVATDASAQASSGDLVTWEAAREAALLHDPWFIPVDHAVVGIVDQHHLEPGEQR